MIRSYRIDERGIENLASFHPACSYQRMKRCPTGNAVRANHSVAHLNEALRYNSYPNHQHRLARVMKPLNEVQLLFVDAKAMIDWPSFATQAMVDLRPQKLYVALAGDGFEAGLTTAQLAVLAKLFAAVAVASATCNVVPLIPAVGMNADASGLLTPELDTCYATEQSAHDAQKCVERLNAARELHSLPAVKLETRPCHASAQPHQLSPDSTAAEAHEGSVYTIPDAAADRVLQFERVSVGGTFDRLHQGHRLLLAATASICTGMVYVGVTADALLASKKGRELLHSYEARCAAALDYLHEVHPGLRLEHGPLADPKAPTLAETDPTMQALVVSQETVSGGLAINTARLARGFAPLTLVVVPLVYRSAATRGEKLSSTQLREQDALQLAHGAAPRQS